MYTEAELRAMVCETLAHVEGVLTGMQPLSREAFLRDDALQLQIRKTIVSLGLMTDRLVLQLRYRPGHPWFGRASRLRWNLMHGHGQLDWTFLWTAIPRDWPSLATALRAELEASEASDETPDASLQPPATC